MIIVSRRIYLHLSTLPTQASASATATIIAIATTAATTKRNLTSQPTPLPTRPLLLPSVLTKIPKHSLILVCPFMICHNYVCYVNNDVGNDGKHHHHHRNSDHRKNHNSQHKKREKTTTTSLTTTTLIVLGGYTKSAETLPNAPGQGLVVSPCLQCEGSLLWARF